MAIFRKKKGGKRSESRASGIANERTSERSGAVGWFVRFERAIRARSAGINKPERRFSVFVCITHCACVAANKLRVSSASSSMSNWMFYQKMAAANVITRAVTFECARALHDSTSRLDLAHDSIVDQKMPLVLRRSFILGIRSSFSIFLFQNSISIKLWNNYKYFLFWIKLQLDLFIVFFLIDISAFFHHWPCPFLTNEMVEDFFAQQFQIHTTRWRYWR